MLFFRFLLQIPRRHLDIRRVFGENVALLVRKNEHERVCFPQLPALKHFAVEHSADARQSGGLCVKHETFPNAHWKQRILVTVFRDHAPSCRVTTQPMLKHLRRRHVDFGVVQ